MSDELCRAPCYFSKWAARFAEFVCVSSHHLVFIVQTSSCDCLTSARPSTAGIVVIGCRAAATVFNCTVATHASATMYVVKRDGRQEPVHFDKITARILKLSYGLNTQFCDPVRTPTLDQ